MRVLRNHGLPATSLTDVFRATIIAKLTCSSAWSGLTSAHDRARIDAFLRRSKRYGYCADSVPAITDIFAEADESLFRRILNNQSHVLHQLLPEKTNCSYNLRSRQHNRQLTRKSTHINDSLYKDLRRLLTIYDLHFLCRNFCFRIVFRCVLSTSYIRIYGWMDMDMVCMFVSLSLSLPLSPSLCVCFSPSFFVLFYLHNSILYLSSNMGGQLDGLINSFLAARQLYLLI